MKSRSLDKDMELFQLLVEQKRYVNKAFVFFGLFVTMYLSEGHAQPGTNILRLLGLFVSATLSWKSNYRI